MTMTSVMRSQRCARCRQCRDAGRMRAEATLRLIAQIVSAISARAGAARGSPGEHVVAAPLDAAQDLE